MNETMPKCKASQVRVYYVKLKNVKGWQGPLFNDREIEKAEDWFGHNRQRVTSKCVGKNTGEGQMRFDKLTQRLL